MKVAAPTGQTQPQVAEDGLGLPYKVESQRIGCCSGVVTLHFRASAWRALMGQRLMEAAHRERSEGFEFEGEGWAATQMLLKRLPTRADPDVVVEIRV